MPIWILVVFVGYGGNAEIHTQEFEGVDACLNARAIILGNNAAQSSKDEGREVTIECVPKRVRKGEVDEW